MIDKGGLAVLKTALAVMGEGMTALSPHTDNLRYDLAAEKDGKFARLQVKSRRLRNGVIRLEMWSNSSDTNKHYYTSDEIDLIALYCPDTDQVYWIPMTEIDGMKEIRVRVEPVLKNRSRVREAKHYTIDKLKSWLDGKTCKQAGLPDCP